ncbi:MAG: hypothetical protein KC505_11555 [Myxococcales bacterium]|nr:hypothetical protein [Myxococcales bacterium]USN50948.1 MAG: hypothetical protein H6731_00585 [Myxococcales bacterium]
MEKYLFTFILLVSFLLSLESLTSAGRLSLSDELAWLFNKEYFLNNMDIIHIKELIRGLRDKQIELRKNKDDKNFHKIYKLLGQTLSKANELERALYRTEQVERNYKDRNPQLIRQTKSYVERTKQELLKLLRDFYDGDNSLEKIFEL